MKDRTKDHPITIVKLPAKKKKLVFLDPTQFEAIKYKYLPRRIPKNRQIDQLALKEVVLDVAEFTYQATKGTARMVGHIGFTAAKVILLALNSVAAGMLTYLARQRRQRQVMKLYRSKEEYWRKPTNPPSKPRKITVTVKIEE